GAGLSHEATLAILGRFVTKESAWQVREGAGSARTIDKVTPRATPYTAPLVGTPMAGLRGEMREVRAPNSGIAVRFPAQRALTPGGAPRERLVPSLVV